MDLHENLRGLEPRDWRFFQSKVVESVCLQEAVLASRFWEIHDGETRLNRVDDLRSDGICVCAWVCCPCTSRSLPLYSDACAVSFVICTPCFLLCQTRDLWKLR